MPDIDGKLYAATQVIDEARHVEVFHRYLKKLHLVYPIDPALQAVLNQILQADLWQMKCVGMQVIVESLAMGAFKIMKEGSRDELLRKIVSLTANDEARHVSYGLIYMKDELPRLADPDRDRIEDFAFAAVDALSGRRPGTGLATQLALVSEVGVELGALEWPSRRPGSVDRHGRSRTSAPAAKRAVVAQVQSDPRAWGVSGANLVVVTVVHGGERERAASAARAAGT